MICSKCGNETGTNASMCKLCQAGAPRAMSAAAPAVYSGQAASAAAASGGVSAPSQPQSPQPPVSAQPVASPSPKAAREPRQPRASSGEQNIFAILGLIFAFFHPVCGVAISLVGIFESRKSDSGLIMSVIGLVISVVLIALIVVFFLVNESARNFLGF